MYSKVFFEYLEDEEDVFIKLFVSFYLKFFLMIDYIVYLFFVGSLRRLYFKIQWQKDYSFLVEVIVFNLLLFFGIYGDVLKLKN